ncbi:MAG: LuxR C-terminal-related transcriptional regulator [Oscillospiraceae bacterium]|jgi:LuxR family maltose regulon positive regulatory protein|nr:LuxR C-terminal-related transcriptional regulator [Oscillospiraceae bacterium]
MVTPNIKNNKYTPDPLPEIYAPRRELVARLEQAAKKKLILISAPAGSGKTVSTLLWMRGSGRKPAWIGLDALDNSTLIFYRMFCAGILSAQPDNARMTSVLQDPAFSSSPVEYTIDLLSGFLMDGDEYILALDDFHTITNQEILKSLPFILRRMPHSFVTLILSRNEPPFAELIRDGRAAVVGPEHLAFTGDEIKEYFISRGRGVSEGEAETVRAYTGGWAIGVNALAQSSSPAPQGSGGHVLENYIKTYIWDEWDDTLRAFLLTSAAVDELPVPLCEKITGDPGAGELLERLRALNIFVTRIEDGVYRYHHLFLDFLRARPEYAGADKKKSWRTAAEYYSGGESHFIARRYACDSGNIRTILDVMYKFMKNSGHSIDEYVNIVGRFYLAPGIENLCKKCPVLYISCAYAAWLVGDSRAFEANADKLTRALPGIILKHPRFAYGAFSLVALDYRTPFAKQIAQASLLPPMVFKDDEIRSVTLSLQMPFLHRSCRDFYELTDKKLYGKLKKTYGKLLKNHYELIMHGVSSGLYLEQNRINDALAEAQAAVSGLNGGTVKEIRFGTYMHLVAVYLAMGKKADFEETLEQAGRFVNEDAQFLRPNFLAFTARVRIWNGDPDAAREWLDHYFVTESATLEPYRLYQYFTTARAYAALWELEKAKDLAARLRQMGKDFRRPQDAAEAGVLLAAVLWAEDSKDEAQRMLETVLSEMQPLAFIRLIADEGAAVLPVLKKVSGKTERPDYRGGLDPVYVNNVYIAAYAVSRQRKGIMADHEKNTIKLSRQQKKIVELLAKGYKRESIIEKTGLSLNTVKSHTRIAYEKLGVGNAADAVMKARELGLVE